MTATQTEMDLQSRGQSDVLAHLGAATVASVFNIIQVVASQKARFSWNDVKPLLPAGIRHKLSKKECPNGSGALMKNAAVHFGYRAVGFVTSADPDARGRAIREWERTP